MNVPFPPRWPLPASSLASAWLPCWPPPVPCATTAAPDGEVRAFRAVNGLPDSVYLPAWAVMQLGAFGAIPASAAAAWLAGDGELAARLLIGGTGTWALAKAVKRIVRRPRPVTLRFWASAVAAATPAASDTCPGTRAWPSSLARLPCPVSARAAAPSP